MTVRRTVPKMNLRSMDELTTLLNSKRGRTSEDVPDFLERLALAIGGKEKRDERYRAPD
jgi:hypothetical protein